MHKLTWHTSEIFWKLYNISKGSSSSFFNILQQNGWSPFNIFRHYETSNFFNFPKFGGGFENLEVRYIRTFDVISELYCVSLRKRPRFEKSAPIGITTLHLNYSEGTLWMFETLGIAPTFRRSRIVYIYFLVGQIKTLLL